VVVAVRKDWLFWLLMDGVFIVFDGWVPEKSLGAEAKDETCVPLGIG
jgi:hypothetical protein